MNVHELGLQQKLWRQIFFFGFFLLHKIFACYTPIVGIVYFLSPLHASICIKLHQFFRRDLRGIIEYREKSKNKKEKEQKKQKNKILSGLALTPTCRAVIE
jgi:hypothetical protein